MPQYVASTVNAQYKPGLVDGPAGGARFRAPSSVCEIPLAAARRASDAPDADKKHAKAAVLVADTGNNALRLLLQARTLDPQPDAQQAAEAGWQQLLRTAPAPMLAATAAPLLPGWLRLLSAPSGAAVPTAELLLPLGARRATRHL